MARPKIENPASRHAAFSKRRVGLFKKARELAVLCDAEVAIIIISAEGKIHQYASSSMKNIITRFRTCYDSGDRRALQPKPEEPEEHVPKEVGAPKQKADMLKLRRLLGDDFAQMMNLHELCVLEEKLNKGLFLIKETKINLLQEELDQSRMQEQQVLQKNQMLLKQVEGLQSFVPAIYCPRPISARFPATEHDGRPGHREFLPWASFAAPFAITSNPETGSNLREADNASRRAPPITNDYGHPTMHGTDKDSLPSTSFGAPLAADNSNNKLINTLKPSLHWLPQGVDGTCLS